MEDGKKVNSNISPYNLGKLGEETAQDYLQRKNFKIVAKRFRLYRGEIDLIAYDKKTLVFVEVKTRCRGFLGLPEESVNPRKQNQIRKIAEAYLALNNLEDVECRFDVISLVFNKDGSCSLSHIKDAF